MVLTQEEVARLLEAAPGSMYTAALGAAYGAGLRVSAVANLKVSDIDSRRMQLRIEQRKGKSSSLGPCEGTRCRRTQTADEGTHEISGEFNGLGKIPRRR